jgi:hypothetical protein
MNTYSAKKNSKRHDLISDAAIEYKGGELFVGDIISIWVHCDMMNRSFLKTFDIGVSKT